MDGEKTALVTGASRGIGRAVLETLGRNGYTVIGTATSDQGAKAIGKRLQKEAMQGRGMVLDVTDQTAVDALIAAAKAEFGPIGVLVNNAGITDDNLLMRMKPEQWQAVIDTDLSSIYRLCKAVLKDMMKTRFGRIVNIASVVGVMGNPGQTNYAAAKAGMIGFSKSLAREIGARGITVNVIAPGVIATDMTDALPETQRQALVAAVPLARLGMPRDIAEAVLYLARAAYVTGETLHINGGMYMS